MPTDFSNTTNLVTGATGFVGSHLVDQLLSQKANVKALIRGTTQAAALHDRGVQTLSGDLRDAEAVRDAIRGADPLYHHILDNCCWIVTSDWANWRVGVHSHGVESRTLNRFRNVGAKNG